MPRQETFLSERVNDVLVEVIKTYDSSYAREVFDGVDGQAQKAIAVALEIEANYAPSDIPDSDSPEYEDFLWNEMLDSALEDVRQSPRLYSFFVVSETRASKTDNLYVSPDWPSAEKFAKSRLTHA